MITTHVLDTARGRPAAGVPIVLERATGDGWELARPRRHRRRRARCATSWPTAPRRRTGATG